MCFPRWHGTDKEGVLFGEHYERLNDYALFDSRGGRVEFNFFAETTRRGLTIRSRTVCVSGGSVRSY